MYACLVHRWFIPRVYGSIDTALHALSDELYFQEKTLLAGHLLQSYTAKLHKFFFFFLSIISQFMPFSSLCSERLPDGRLNALTPWASFRDQLCTRNYTLMPFARSP